MFYIITKDGLIIQSDTPQKSIAIKSAKKLDAIEISNGREIVWRNKKKK